MPLGYLITLLLTGLLVGAAAAPPKRPLWAARLGWLLGMVVNEVPLLTLLYVLVATAGAVLADDLLGSGAGWVLLVVALGVMAGCGYLQARVMRARGVLSAALGQRLPARRSVWGARLLPVPRRPRSVERIRDVRYAEGGVEHTLDLYRLRGSDEVAAPVLVYLHGGGYNHGSKHWEARSLMHRLAAGGWVVVSANYGLRPRVGYPGHVVDLKRVLAWIHREATTYGMDPGTIVACGSSAGAHLAMIAALTPGEPAFQPGFEDADTRLAAAIGLYGYYGRYYGWDASQQPPSSPLDLDPRQAPPMMLVHGDHDTYVGVGAARSLARHLRAHSAQPVVLAELPGAQHSFDLLASERFEAVIDGIEVFLARVLAAAPRGERHR